MAPLFRSKVDPYSKHHSHFQEGQVESGRVNTEHLISQTLEGLVLQMLEIMLSVWSLLKDPGLPWEPYHEDPYQPHHLQFKQKMDKATTLIMTHSCCVHQYMLVRQLHFQGLAPYFIKLHNLKWLHFIYQHK